MNRYTRSGLLALVALGGFVFWRNRFQIQRFLESKGISTPLDRTSGIGNTIRSGIAKIAGRVERSDRVA